ncbi:hypothetical protein DFH94DRAFT_615903, partial [Russula ochroleuca]
QKSEESLVVTGSELEKQTEAMADLMHRVDEPQEYSAGAMRYRISRIKSTSKHTVEIVLIGRRQEAADPSPSCEGTFSPEKQDADPVDKNASLEEEYFNVAAFKPLIESHKSQIAELRGKAASRNKVYETDFF